MLPRGRMKTLKLLVLALVLPACGGEIDEAFTAGSSEPIAFSAADAARILDLVNYPGTTLETLDIGARVDSRAAANIIAHRDGADGLALTADDDLFDDLAELQALSYVEGQALARIHEFARQNPPPASEAVEGVQFDGWEAEAVLFGVNTATMRELDEVAGLDSDAATSLLALRPFTSVSQMGAAAYVGPTALRVLRARSTTWWGWRASPEAGIYDGVTFEEPVAQSALDIANEAKEYELVENGVWSTGAARIVASRPYSSLAEVAAVTGVGTVTMQGLYDYAASGNWPAP